MSPDTLELRVRSYAREAYRTGRAPKILRDHHVSTVDAARAIGVHRSNILNWSKGQPLSAPSASRIGRLLLALDPEAPQDLVNALSRA